MNKKAISNAALSVIIAAVSLAVISVVLRSLNLFFFFDSELGYYERGAILPVVANLLLGLGSAFFVVFGFAFFRKKPIEYKKTNIATATVCVISALFCLVLTVSDAVSVINGNRFGLLFAALSFMSGLYFVCAATDLKPVYKIITGVFAIIRLTLMLGGSYFDQQVQMNAPDKVLFGLACVFSMLFIASELKVFVGTARSSVFTFSASIASLLSAASSLPSIIAYHGGRLPENNGLYAEYYLLLAIALYGVACLVSTMITFIKENKNKTDSPESIDQI